MELRKLSTAFLLGLSSCVSYLKREIVFRNERKEIPTIVDEV